MIFHLDEAPRKWRINLMGRLEVSFINSKLSWAAHRRPKPLDGVEALSVSGEPKSSISGDQTADI